MSGVELLPFVWALPVAYFVASYGNSREGQQLVPQRDLQRDLERVHQALPRHWKVDLEQRQRDLERVHQALPGRWKLDGEEETYHHNHQKHHYPKGCINDDEDEALEVVLSRQGCQICFMS
jgi:hypothetical protein